VETLISVPHHDPVLSASLMPESQELYDLARTAVSVAELSALLDIPLAVIRVLVSDLADYGAVVIHPTGHTYRNDRHTLERILNGLKELSL
jgi:hypothetical protein